MPGPDLHVPLELVILISRSDGDLMEGGVGEGYTDSDVIQAGIKQPMGCWATLHVLKPMNYLPRQHFKASNGCSKKENTAYLCYLVWENCMAASSESFRVEVIPECIGEARLTCL